MCIARTCVFYLPFDWNEAKKMYENIFESTAQEQTNSLEMYLDA